jgi:predicted glutamine amidotransferase
MIIEECKRIRELLNGHNGKIPKLKEELDKKLREQAELDDVALTAEILEEKGWEKKKENADKNREEIAMLKSEIEKQEKAIEILKEKGERAI